jgi:hypothetical protein
MRVVSGVASWMSVGLVCESPRWFLPVPRAPKGRPSKAQANGLGGWCERIIHFGPQALKGRGSPAFGRSPLQGSTRKMPSSPSPMAWALLDRPFGAERSSAMTNPHLGHEGFDLQIDPRNRRKVYSD